MAAEKAFSAELEFAFSREQEVNGLMMWFTATLTEDVSLSCAPDSETCWGRTVAPFRHPVTVRPGVPLRVEVQVEPAGPGFVFTHWVYSLGGILLGEGDNRKALI
ncbi:hypothetical protein [Protofrankia symbiont of Coriaria ruscifolia]|uniref:hypothetical protein n=1 Tax=Protofrankia symbiont of Coriaria ruscifolia TaxID=1306542 RepID=UPI0013EFC0B9|nr:hypothetical protein [Protofrankia symbiont of Coriaria ruscifolia]